MVTLKNPWTSIAGQEYPVGTVFMSLKTSRGRTVPGVWNWCTPRGDTGWCNIPGEYPGRV